MPWEWEPSPRDVLIDRVRRGQIGPDEAELEAKKQGFGPLATKPNPFAFDPDEMPWWSLPMAVAWIAWRNRTSVQEHCAEYRDKWLIWICGSWSLPTEDGNEFKRIDGHELKTVGPSTVCRLSLSETWLKSKGQLPTTTKMTVSEAEKQLFAALAAGRIGAIAKDATGNVVDIPKREWPYLELWEDGQRDVLKHDSLEQPAAFSDIKLARDDLKKLWEEDLIQPCMIEPMMRAGTAGYVPLCSAFHWIMTEAGQAVQHLQNSELWKVSVQRLLPLISTGEVQIIGTPNSGGAPKEIEGAIFAGILVSEPTGASFELITGAKPWISCIPYAGEEDWRTSCNDELFLDGSAAAAWTHLQVKKADVLREFSAPTERVPAAQSLDDLPKMQSGILEVAKQLWPTGNAPQRVKERNQAIQARFGKNPPSERTIRRALKDWP
jgi:hypothetical protein